MTHSPATPSNHALPTRAPRYLSEEEPVPIRPAATTWDSSRSAEVAWTRDEIPYEGVKLTCALPESTSRSLDRRCATPVASCQYLRQGLFIASNENLREDHRLKAWFTTGLTAAGFFARERLSSWPVSARICLDWAAGRTLLNSAFMRIIGRLRMSSRPMAR